MYSPKISETFIPTLYRMAKEQGVRMTVLINQIISQEIQKQKEKEATNERDIDAQGRRTGGKRPA
jgi:hypothetical protein